MLNPSHMFSNLEAPIDFIDTFIIDWLSDRQFKDVTSSSFGDKYIGWKHS